MQSSDADGGPGALSNPSPRKHDHFPIVWARRAAVVLVCVAVVGVIAYTRNVVIRSSGKPVEEGKERKDEKIPDTRERVENPTGERPAQGGKKEGTLGRNGKEQKEEADPQPEVGENTMEDLTMRAKVAFTAGMESYRRFRGGSGNARNAHLRDAARHLKKAMDLYKLALAKDPDDVRIQNRLSEANMIHYGCLKYLQHKGKSKAPSSRSDGARPPDPPASGWHEDDF